MAVFTTKWFALYYPILGLLFLLSGIGLIIKKKAFTHYLLGETDDDTPPLLIRTVLKYFFLFTIVCFLLSFLPFSWTELLFSLWSFMIVFIIGRLLVRWSALRHSIKQHADQLPHFCAVTGVMMVTASPVIFLLAYFIIQKIVHL